MKTPYEIAREALASIKESPLALFGTDVAALIVAAIEADRAQRRIILTQKGNSWRVWVDTPAEAFAQMQEGLEIDTPLEEWEWEK